MWNNKKEEVFEANRNIIINAKESDYEKSISQIQELRKKAKQKENIWKPIYKTNKQLEALKIRKTEKIK